MTSYSQTDSSSGPGPAPVLPARLAALVGLAAGAAALAAAELVAGFLPGAISPVIAVGDLVIALQPPGAKDFVVSLFGTNDKLALNVLIIVVALAGAAAIGILARSSPTAATIGFGAGGLLALAAGLREPLVEPIAILAVAVVAVLVGIGVHRLLMSRLESDAAPATAEMPDWQRRRVLGTSLALIGVSIAGGWLGRALAQGRADGGTAAALPSPAAPAPSPPAGSFLTGIDGLSPLVTPNTDFYRIDVSLLVPRPDIETWRLRMTGMVDRELEISYDELKAMPLFDQYVTIACVSNEVGGGLVGNARWTGVRLKDLFAQAGVQPDATQVVGRAVDGFTVGFPLGYALAEDREPMVVIGMNGEPLPANHGFPARLIVPGLFGYVSATKWLAEIELTTWEAFDAYWVPLGWSKEGPILTQSRIDTPHNGDRLSIGTIPIAGVAWAPDRGVSGVEVRIDEGDWVTAETSTPISDATWVQFVHRWEATPGDHRIAVRATDGDGEVQTDVRTPPAPDGARGYHTIGVSVG